VNLVEARLAEHLPALTTETEQQQTYSWWRLALLNTSPHLPQKLSNNSNHKVTAFKINIKDILASKIKQK
jgi:hypothetical protein